MLPPDLYKEAQLVYTVPTNFLANKNRSCGISNIREQHRKQQRIQQHFYNVLLSEFSVS